ncbi:MAG: hypothetical protein CME64_17200 [Halobacteriovoraceae bacterium]|nr:hypothetical protein [Halobacteriovoraceae bacterium]|tara:strand:+ start:263158 stop:265557 length:2400 start_codon:yes stop_codon:yes gene_type:complete
MKLKKPPRPQNDVQRLEELNSFKIIDTPQEREFDDLANLAAAVTGCECAIISFVDKDKVWFKAMVGFEGKFADRDESICSHAIMSDEIFEVNDLSLDERFKDYTIVSGEPFYKFYAGVPLVTGTGYSIGTLCVLERKKRKLSSSAKAALKAIARQIVFTLQAKKQRVEFEESQKVAKIGNWHYEINEKKISWSKQLFVIFGLDPKGVEPQFEEHIKSIHPEDRELWKTTVEKCSQDGEPYEIVFRGMRPNGETVWLKAFGEGIKNSKGKIVSMGGTCQDITKSKLLELKNEEIREVARKQLEEQKRFLSNTLDNMPAVVYAKDVEGKFIAINEVFRKLFKLTDEEVIGKTNHEVFPHEIAEAFRKNDLEIIKSKAVQESEELAIGSDGKRRAYYSLKFPYFDDEGNVIATGGVSLDITEKKEFERQAFHNAKLASIGELAAGVGHEINNPLTIVKGYAASILSRAEAGVLNNEILKKYLEQIDKASDRIAKIVQGLRNFSRFDDEGLAPINLNEPLTESVEMIRDIYGRSGVQLELSLPDEPLIIHGNSGKLQQVFINLLANAKDATKNQEERSILVNAEKTRDSIILTFKDNGEGISPEIQERIFDPFFTTKEVNEGTGIGLSISHTIIQEHGGQIRCESIVGKGTSFIIELPFLEKMHKPEGEEDVRPQLRKYKDLKALVVDDEEGIRFVLSEMLVEMGVIVKCAANGQEGMEIIEQNPKFDLIISDMKMPIMDGPTFVKEVRKSKSIQNQPKIVFITGGVNVDIEDENNELRDLVDGLLLKPFDKEKVAQVLNLAV